MRSFVRSFIRTFLRSYVRLFVRPFVRCLPVGWFVRSFVGRSFMGKVGRPTARWWKVSVSVVTSLRALSATVEPLIGEVTAAKVARATLW